MIVLVLQGCLAIWRAWPKTTFCIVSNEFCERFSYYGLRNEKRLNEGRCWSTDKLQRCSRCTLSTSSRSVIMARRLSSTASMPSPARRPYSASFWPTATLENSSTNAVILLQGGSKKESIRSIVVSQPKPIRLMRNFPHDYFIVGYLLFKNFWLIVSELAGYLLRNTMFRFSNGKH